MNENSDEYKFLYDSMFVKTYVDGQPIKEEDNFIYRYEELDVNLSKSNKLDEESIDNMDASTYRDNFVIEREVKIYPSTLDYQSDYIYAKQRNRCLHLTMNMWLMMTIQLLVLLGNKLMLLSLENSYYEFFFKVTK